MPEFRPNPSGSLNEKVKESLKNKVTKIGSFLKYPELFKIPEENKAFFNDKKFQKDTTYLRRKRELIEQNPLSQSELETLQMSKALESFLIDKLPSILDTETVAHPALDYVDMAQGSDLILEAPAFNDFLSIDVTLGAGGGYKLEETSHTYDKGEIYKADYFVGTGNTLTKIDSMPHVVLGLDRAHFEKMIPAWLKGDDMSPEVARIILSEGITQLKVYSKFFESKNMTAIAERFTRFAELFENSLQKLNKDSAATATGQDYDQVQEMIENSLLQNYHSSITEAASAKPESKTPKTGKVIKIPRPPAK